MERPARSILVTWVQRENQPFRIFGLLCRLGIAAGGPIATMRTWPEPSEGKAGVQVQEFW
jgi:hypothetical protein